MADRKSRVRDLVEDSRYWDAEDLLKNLEEEMQRLERGLGQVMFDSEGRPITKCVTPLPLTPKSETKEEGDAFVLKVDLPGVDKEDILLYVNREAIEVRAVSGESICRPYYISVDTPWSVHADEAEVKFENRLLTVKAKRLKKTRVPVR